MLAFRVPCRVSEACSATKALAYDRDDDVHDDIKDDVQEETTTTSLSVLHIDDAKECHVLQGDAKGCDIVQDDTKGCDTLDLTTTMPKSTSHAPPPHSEAHTSTHCLVHQEQAHTDTQPVCVHRHTAGAVRHITMPPPAVLQEENQEGQQEGEEEGLGTREGGRVERDALTKLTLTNADTTAREGHARGAGQGFGMSFEEWAGAVRRGGGVVEASQCHSEICGLVFQVARTLWCVAALCGVLQHSVVCCSTLWCVAALCGVLQHQGGRHTQTSCLNRHTQTCCLFSPISRIHLAPWPYPAPTTPFPTGPHE